MIKVNYTIIFFIIFLLLFNCANRGTPQGGPKDESPPVIVEAEPENFSSGFSANVIKIKFDEYIKIKDLQKNLIISPPMKTIPEITPLGSASKEITIKIFDTLQPNTTYAFNFGESIVDNNEENPYPYYRYIFSTGTYIDSLQLKGNVKDALEYKTDDFISVMLYAVDSTFTDSIIYKEKPKYVTSTLDSTNTFELQNLKSGKYLLIALKEENSNYTFEQLQDKIGFVKEFVTIPTDSSYTISLFKEEPDFKILRPKLKTKSKIAIGFQGSRDSVKIKALGELPKTFTCRVIKAQQSDTLFYFFKPKTKGDSLLLKVSKQHQIDTLNIRIRQIENDSLKIDSSPKGIISFLQDLSLTGNNPFTTINTENIKVLDKDSIPVNFSISFDSIRNKYHLKFDKTEKNNYKITLLPGALTDLFSNESDSINLNLRTKKYDNYSNLRLTLNNAVYPVIVQLVNEKGEVKYERYVEHAKPIDFKYLDTGNYFLRVIFDADKNGNYDTGSYLKKRFPERVSYYPRSLEIRAGWDYIENFTLK